MNNFLDSYQIMRNLVHISHNGLVVFLYPEANKKIHQQAQTIYKNILSDSGKDRFKILLLERIINNIMKRIKTKKLHDHYKAFIIKYLSYGAT